ncbi:MAG TPA: PAS domain-containing protein [Alphaproteobacteria bacterium]|nr:PAS domain-containing protein [Alphaproteobacteria bacterium]
MSDNLDNSAESFRDRIRHPELRRLYDYWSARRSGRRYPGRLDIDPVELKFALGNVSLIEVVDDTPPRFRWRLVGSLLVQRLGNDMTNRLLDEYPNPAYRDYLIDTYRQMVATGEPSRSINERVIDGKPREFEVLRLPLAENGEKVDMILICSMYFEALPARSPVAGPASDGGGPPRVLEDC